MLWLRIAVAVVGAVLAVTSGVNAYVNVTHRENPALALAIAPQDAVAITSALDSAIIEQGTDALNAPDLVPRASESLRQEALNPNALRLIGLARSRTAFWPGASAFELAAKMSRRDLNTQLWLIEASVNRQDVAGALSHYDSALRIDEASAPILYPVLTTALENPQIWGAFLPYFEANPPWLSPFARYAVRNSKQPARYAELFARGGGMHRQGQESIVETELLQRLANDNEIVAAVRYIASLPGATPTLAREIGFSGASTSSRFPPFTWELSTSAETSILFTESESGSAIELAAEVDAGTSTVLARKLVVLPPGRYHFRATQFVRGDRPSGEAGWRARCGANYAQAALWSQTAALTGTAQPIEHDFEVFASCPAVAFELVATVPASGDRLQIVVGSPTLQRRP